MSAIEEQLNIGEDSFMDTIANLVGVLIILVAVVGMKAEKLLMPRDSTHERKSELQALGGEVQAKIRTANSIEIDSSRLQSDLAREEALGSRLSTERNQKLVLIELARRQIAEKSSAMDEQARKRIELIAEQSRLRQELDQLQSRKRFVAAEPPPEIDLIHYPTPIAKTVFSDEIHFRLESGRLVFVPINELIDQMKGEWKFRAEKMSANSEAREAIGPIENFRMEYELIAEHPESDDSTADRREVLVRLNRFLISPIKSDLGESTAQALSPSSQFCAKLSRMTPHKTTVSIWVYPDSYEALREVKNWLRERGFQTACWPLETGRPISGGPNGLRTTAQ